MTNEVVQTVAAVGTAATQQVGSAASQELAKWQAVYDKAMGWIGENGVAFLVNVIVAVLILIIGWLVSRALCHVTRKALEKTRHINSLLENFIVSVVSKCCWVLILMLVLQRLGINIAPLIAGLGVTGFILGFAFQESLGNLASGMMIALNQPFKIGDYVVAGGVEGSIIELNMMATTIATADNKKVVVPNKVVWGAAITNFSSMSSRRVDLTTSISYSADISKARKVALEVMKANKLVLTDPAPICEIVSMGDSGINLAIRPWAKPGDYWTVFFQINQAVKEAFDKNGIEIPFPQLDVRMTNK
jgi:small conductance mechanosensitive channel